MVLGRHFAWQARLPVWQYALLQLSVLAAFGSLMSCLTALLTGGPHLTVGLWHGDLSLPDVAIWAAIGNFIQVLARQWTLHRLKRRLART